MSKACAGCGLHFGGDHWALPRHVEGLGDVCQWCYKDIKERGLEYFKQSMKAERSRDQKRNS